MYRIIGGDRKEYGPVAAEELRRWLAEGRLNAQSLAAIEPGGEWKPLSAFPELAAAFNALSGAAPGLSAAPPPIDPQAWGEHILSREPRVEIGRCLSRSFSLFAGNAGLLLGATLVVWLLGFIQFVPIVSLVYKILWGALFGGFYLVFLKRIRGQEAGFGDTFSGFSGLFGQLVLAGFLSSLLAGLGMFFCLIPGIYLTVAWVFTIPLVSDKRMEFWPAMELSRKVVNRVWFPMFGLLLLAYLPVIVVSLFGIVKFTLIGVEAIHQSVISGQFDVQRMMPGLMRFRTAGLEWGLITRLVLLVNFPFAVGALMYAYEDLFGTRPAPSA